MDISCLFHILYILALSSQSSITFILELYSFFMMLQNWNIVLWLYLWPLKYIKLRIVFVIFSHCLNKTWLTKLVQTSVTWPYLLLVKKILYFLFLHFYYAYLFFFLARQHCFVTGIAVRSYKHIYKFTPVFTNTDVSNIKITLSDNMFQSCVWKLKPLKPDRMLSWLGLWFVGPKEKQTKNTCGGRLFVETVANTEVYSLILHSYLGGQRISS